MNRFRRISSITLLTVIMLTMACETDRIIFNGPYFVRFTDTAMTEKESHSSVIKIQVHNGGPAPKSDVTINYIIGGTAREGIDYVINGTRGKVKIKSGEYFGYIEVQLINNSNNILRSQDLKLTLQNITDDNSDLDIGQGVSQIGRTFTLTIQDDCILGGDYYGIVKTGDVPVDDITITSLDCEEYVLSNWNVYNDSLSFLAIPDLSFTDNGDNTLTIPPQKTNALNPDSATIDGFGVVNPATRAITFTVRFADYVKKPQFTFQLIAN